MTIKRALTIIIVIALITAGAGVYEALNSVKFTPWIIKKIVAQYFPQVIVDSVQIDAQKFRFPNELTFKGIRATIKQNNTRYVIEAGNLVAQGLLTAWRPNNDLEIVLERFQLSSDIGSIRDLSATVHMGSVYGEIKSMIGNVQLQQGRFGLYEINNAASVLGYRERGVLFKSFSAEAYGAKLNGEISLEYPPSLSYSVQMTFKGLDVSRLKAINDALPSQIEGIFSGSLRMAGRQSDIEDLDLETHVVRDGKIRASLLSFVTQYMPSSKEREYLDKALESNGKVNVEKGSVQLKSISKNKLTALVKLFSKELNLDQNFVIDINSDGKLTTLLDYVDQFSIK